MHQHDAVGENAVDVEEQQSNVGDALLNSHSLIFRLKAEATR